MATIRLLLVSDDERSVSGLRTGSDDVVDVRGPVPSSAVSAALTVGPCDVVLVCVTHTSLSDVVGEIRSQEPSARILVEGEADRPGFLPAVLAAGGCGVVAPGAEPARLRDAIARAHAGELVLDEGGLRRLVREVSDDLSSRRAGTASLTARELEVLGAIAAGLDTTSIASSLAIAPATVQAHVKSVLAKLRVHSKVEAVRVAWRDGVLAVPA